MKARSVFISVSVQNANYKMWRPLGEKESIAGDLLVLTKLLQKLPAKYKNVAVTL